MPMIDVRQPAVLALSPDERAATAEALAYRITDCDSMLRLLAITEDAAAVARWRSKRAALEAAQAKVGIVTIRFGEVTTT